MAITNQQLYDTWKASEEHLNDILSKLNATLAVKAADTDAELALIKTELESIKDQITAIKSTDGIKKIADAVKVTADDNTIAGLGALAAAAVTDPAASASVIALLKGMLKQLQGTGTGAAPIQLTGSIVPDDQAVPVRGVQKVEIETIINAESVATRGNTGMKTFDGKGADLIYLLINVDQAWHALARAPWTTATVALKLLYPDVSTSQTARPTLSYPDIVLYTLAGADGIGAATTLTDAAQHALAWRTADLSSSNMGVIIYNDGDNTASVTVKVLRIWR